MTIKIELPVAACSGCLRSYTLDQWRELEFAAAKLGDDADDLERRVCDVCGGTMAYNLDGLEDCDLTMDADRFEQLWPHSDLPRQARAAYRDELGRRHALTLRRRNTAITILAVVVAVAALLLVVLSG